MDARMRNVPCRILLCGLLLIAGTACRRSASATEEAPVLTGSERFAWDQKAADRTELSKLRYAMYVDGTRTEIGGATCSDTAGCCGIFLHLPVAEDVPRRAHASGGGVRDGLILRQGKLALRPRPRRHSLTAHLVTPLSNS
jgi:hypothetical protein